MTRGTKVRTTPSIIFKVRGLEEELVTVMLNLGSRDEGMRLGYMPTTPNRVVLTMVRAEANQAFHQEDRAMNTRVVSRAKTATKGMINKTGRAR